MRLLFPLFALSLAACNQVTPLDAENDSAPAATKIDPRDIAPGARAVRIGEAGPNFAACATRGTVVNTGGDPTLPVRAAPFTEAETVGAGLAEGARVIVCTQTIDQRWMGVIVPPADQPDGDCGVGVRVPSPRAYEGPCQSGWVTTAFVRTTAR